MYPHTRIVHIVRDPRDVAASHGDAWGTTPLRAALRWRRCMQQDLQWRSSLPADRYLVLNYEDLVHDPEGTARRVCDHLGLTFSSAMLAPERRATRGFTDLEPHKVRTLTPITVQQVGRWSSRLAPEDVNLVEAVAGQHLTARGYTRSMAARSRPRAGLTAIAQVPSFASEQLRPHVRTLTGRRRDRSSG